MLIKPYNQEILDGLENKLGNNAIAFNCSLTKSNAPTDITVKAVAAFGEGRNFDLYYIQSILASIGANKNDDWFLAEEVWAARHTPVHKQLNFMHDEKNIIGVITDSILLNAAGQNITSEADISSIIDIATQAVIWTHWDDKKLESKISKIIASIENDKLFVSMEALFKKFDYMLVKGSECKIVLRTEQTAFLTKHLRSYGGSGEFDGARIYRILRDFTFSGKGIVDDPANPRSVIDESIFDNAKDCECGGCEECEDSSESPEEGLEFEDGEDIFDEFDSVSAATDKKVRLNKPFRTPGGPKKFSVYVKNDKGNVVKVNFGDPNMSIKRDDPERRKSFRARHNCDNPGPKWKAKYWSCKFWSSTNVSKLVSTKAENIMEDNLNKEVAELKTALAKANETIATLNKQEVEKVSAEVSNLKEQVVALKALAEQAQAEKDKMEKECAEKMDEKEKEACAKMKEMEDDCCAKVEDAEAKLAEVEKEKTEALRVSKLVAFNVPEDKAKEVVKTFASVNDTMFDEIAALYSNKTAAKVEDKTATTVEDAVEAAKAAVNKPEVKIDKIEENEDRLTTISKSIAEKLNFIKNKGNK
jgi:hypothetical protein